MPSRWIKTALIVATLLLPLLISWSYHAFTSPPGTVVIATGPAGGRYAAVSRSLADTIQNELNIRVELRDTSGSLENLRLLESGDVDLALYQHGARSIMQQHHMEPNPGAGRPDPAVATTFIANLYSEVAHLIVHEDADMDRSSDWRNKRVAVGGETSGDFALSLLFLDHIGLSLDDIEAEHASYLEIEERFREGSLDAALITSGPGAPILRQLLGEAEEHHCDIRSIQFADALAARHITVSPYTIPAGYYRTQEPVKPGTDVETVSFRAQLLTRSDVSTRLVESVTRIVLDEQFQADNDLAELFAQGREFASDKPEFDVHHGAVHVFEPELKPILNTDFVEATEGIRSFVVSLLIAGYLAFRWWREREQRSKEHRLDRYILAVLDIEQRQLDFDQQPGADDTTELQDLLDEVTALRQEALREFSAHEINEDRAVECFVEMCHALSDKINAKLTRQRIQAGFQSISPPDISARNEAPDV